MGPSRNPPSPPGGGRDSNGQRPSDSTQNNRASLISSTDDEYELMVNAVSDGFRPANPNTSPPAARRRPPPPPPSALQPPPMAVSPATSKLSHRPSSTAKAPRSHDSLTIRADGSSNPNNNPPSHDNHCGGAPQLRIESPYRGPSDPSHPYQMYPQRTLSNATDSTAAQDGRGSFAAANNAAAPQQYNLFGQSTVPAATNSQQPIPVGFTGLGTTYQRRIGPDGEDAGDLIGPLGHTEELPPYTRYPEVAFTSKPSAAGQAAAAAGTEPAGSQDSQATQAVQNAPPVQNEREEQEEAPTAAEQASPLIDDAGGLANAPQEPEYTDTPRDTLMPSRSRHSTRSYASSNNEINAAKELVEKRPQTKWQRRARKKLWGIIPYWSICLVVCGMVLMGIVMGAVVGSVLTKNKNGDKTEDKKPYPDKGPPPSPTAIDIQPLDTPPTGLPSLTTGGYSIPQLEISQSKKNCFNDTKQAQAWSCKMPFRYYNMNITEDPDRNDVERYNLTLTSINNSDPLYIMGTQPPNIPDPVPLRLVNDTFEDGRGPAWWVKVSYNKTVIVDEDLFSADGDGQGATKRSWVYTGPPVADVDPSSRFSRKGVTFSDGQCPWVCTWPDTTLEIFIYPQQNVSVPTTTPSSPTPTDYTDTDDDNYWNLKPLSPYPQVVKMLERRQPGMGVATCRKVRILKHGLKAQVVYDGGKPVEVTINESADSLMNQYSGRGIEMQPREALELTPCGCLWLSV